MSKEKEKESPSNSPQGKKLSRFRSIFHPRKDVSGSKSAILTIEELKVTLDTNMDQLEGFVRAGDIPQFIETAKVWPYSLSLSCLLAYLLSIFLF